MAVARQSAVRELTPVRPVRRIVRGVHAEQMAEEFPVVGLDTTRWRRSQLLPSGGCRA